MDVHKVHLHAFGNSLSEALASLGVQAGATVSLSISSFSDDQLLAELRQRMASKGMIVRVAKFDEEQGQLPLTTAATPATNEVPKTEATSPRPRGRPPNASKQISDEGRREIEEAAKRETKPEPKREAAKPVAQAVADEWDEDPAGDEAGEAPTKVTKEDVKAALNRFNAIKGMVTARQMLDRIGGSQKLMDIDAKHYPAIVAEINRELAASGAA